MEHPDGYIQNLKPKTKTKNLNPKTKPRTVNACAGEKVMQWQPPHSGIVSLTFISNRRPPQEDSTFSEAELRLCDTATASALTAPITYT